MRSCHPWAARATAWAATGVIRKRNAAISAVRAAMAPSAAASDASRSAATPKTTAYLNRGLGSKVGGERLCRFVAAVGPVVPRAPGLIWVLGLGAGDVMVDGSIRVERLRPLGLWWTAARGRESRSCGSGPEEWLSSETDGLGGTKRCQVR
jgi:hypothetical protein